MSSAYQYKLPNFQSQIDNDFLRPPKPFYPILVRALEQSILQRYHIHAIEAACFYIAHQLTGTFVPIRVVCLEFGTNATEAGHVFHLIKELKLYP